MIMKKLLALFMGVLCLVGCACHQQEQREPVVIDLDDPQVQDFMEGFAVVPSTDDIKVERLDVKVFQVFEEGVCLAMERNPNFHYHDVYDGNVVLYFADDESKIYDGRIIKGKEGKAYYVGTYTYISNVGKKNTVKVYMEYYDFAYNFVELGNRLKEKKNRNHLEI